MEAADAWAVVAFFLGAAAGFQGVFERYRHDSGRASVTLPGLLYLVSRGAIPAVLYLGLKSGGLFQGRPWLLALFCSVGLETLLRTRFYIKQSPGEGPEAKELWRGLFDLLRWYQNLLLELAAGGLAERRKQFILTLLGPSPDFQRLLAGSRNHLPSWPNLDVKSSLSRQFAQLENNFNKDSAAGKLPQQLNLPYSLKLGYLLLDELGESGCQTFLG